MRHYLYEAPGGQGADVFVAVGRGLHQVSAEC